MKKQYILFCLIALLCPPFLNGETLATNVSLQKIVKSLDNIAEDTHLGVLIVSMDNGRILYQKNIKQHFTPASTLKLFTAYTALSLLSPHYVYETTLSMDKVPIKKHRLTGNTYLTFSGDPTLRDQHIRQFIQQLHHQGIRTIQGDFILDLSRFGGDDYGPGWAWDDRAYCFSAPISALILNKNCFTLDVVAPRRPGDAAHIRITSRKPTPYVKTQVITSVRKPIKDCPIEMTFDSRHIYHVKGCLPQHAAPKRIIGALNKPIEDFQVVLSDLLSQHHIELTGTIKKGFLPQNTKPIARHHSKPLHKLVKTMLKKSDNLIANSLFKTVGAVYYHAQGNWKNGEKAALEILARKTNINPNNLKVVDGAGLSRYNLVTPLQVGQVLYAAYHDFNPGYDFISGLPIGGHDGTLRSRLRQQHTWGKVRAKTGTMNGINSLAGYVTTTDKSILGFVILTDAHLGPKKNYERVIDQVVHQLAHLKLSSQMTSTACNCNCLSVKKPLMVYHKAPDPTLHCNSTT